MIVIFIIVEFVRYKQSVIEFITKRNILVRWLVYIGMITLFLVFGMYGSQYNPADFIYKHF